MIPRTFPSEFVTPNGKTQAIVYSLPSVSGLKAWIDYIPVKGVANSNTVVENTYAADGYMLVRNLDAIAGMTPFKDYIPVYEDATATKPWSTDVGGYIPMYGLFSVQGLFAAGEQGAWYDPSDLTTLFQDSAGTTPVTAVEQPVGLMLDKSKGLVLGSELVTNGDFSNGTTGWTAVGLTASVVSGEAEITRSGVGQRFYQSMSVTSGKSYKISFSSRSGTAQVGVYAGSTDGASDLFPATLVSSGSSSTYSFVARASGASLFLSFYANTSGTGYIDNISVKELPGNHAYQATSANRPVLSARVNLLTGTASLSTQTVTTQATNYTLKFSGTGTVALTGTATLAAVSAGTYTFNATAGSLVVTVVGSVTNADIRPTNAGVGLPSYQSVTNPTTYDTTGFPLYLKFNGTNSSLATNSINFTATDKMTVFAGVRKLSDAATGIVAELSVDSLGNNGAFRISAPANAGADKYLFTSIGTSIAIANTTNASFNAPITNVVTGIGDISGDSAILRVNGTQAASRTADQGTGNYGNYPLYIGARAGSSLYFNGQLYSLIVRGATSTSAQITAAETWVNTKTGAY